ncbi:MAG TPA: PAS domain S-box protein [Syntrophorhabdaceae bacterium]|nr:PAS domain S-box protein [Syntrophorhabdaceae bacterium]
MEISDFVYGLIKERDTFKAFTEANPDLLFLLDCDGTILECKAGLPSNQYVPGEKLIGKKIFDTPIGGEAQKFKDAFEDVKRTGQIANIEYSTFIEGVEQFFEARITPIRSLSNEIFLVITRNISSTQKEFMGLQLFSKTLEAIIEFLPDATFVVDSERKVIAWNRAIEEITGIEKKDIVGKGDYAYAVPFYGEKRPILIDFLFEEHPEIEKHYDFVKKINDTYYTEVYVPKIYNGRGGYLWASAKRLFDENGKIIGAIESVRDITEIKKIQNALKIERERLKSLLESLPIGVMLIENDGSYSYLNPEFTKMVDYTIDEIPNGREWFRKAFPDENDRKKALRLWIEDVNTLKTQSKVIRDMKIKDKNGNERDIQFHTTLLPTGQTLTVCEDITEQHLLKQRLMHAQKMEAIGVLAGGVAHDFNNLLMAIQGNVSLMLFKLEQTHPFYKRLTTIENLIKNGALLTRQLLEFSRGAKKEIKPLYVKEAIEKTIDMFRRMKKEVTVHFDYKGEPEIIEADASQFEQMLINLFINAWQAMEENGEIFVEAEGIFLDKRFTDNFLVPQGRYIRISVRDTGVGMDEKTMEKIFDPFFTTKEVGKGVGLGLTTVYGIVKNHKGIIDVKSELGKGSTFTVYLPASQTPNKVGIVMPRAKKQKDRTVLLVDDEMVILEVGKELLEVMGYKVLTASNGLEAVKIYKDRMDEIDLVILDMIMPGKGGEETFVELKEINRDIKVLLASGYSIEGSAERIMGRGCSGFIQKPFNLNELSVKLKEILGE